LTGAVGRCAPASVQGKRVAGKGGGRRASATGSGQGKGQGSAQRRVGEPMRLRAATVPAAGRPEVRAYIRTLFKGLGGSGNADEYSDDKDFQPTDIRGRDTYDTSDVEQYYNFMGILAGTGNYDRLDELIGKTTYGPGDMPGPGGMDCVDALMFLAAGEGDYVKLEEVLKAGANVKAVDKTTGKTAQDCTTNDQCLALFKQFSPK